MSPLDLALKYMDIFYSTASPTGLEEIMDPDCVFEGPFHHFSSAKAYIHSLVDSPPRNMNVTVLESYQNNRSACLSYSH